MNPLPDRSKYKSLEVDLDLHERFVQARYHHRQSSSEFIRCLLDHWDAGYPAGPWMSHDRP